MLAFLKSGIEVLNTSLIHVSLSVNTLKNFFVPVRPLCMIFAALKSSTAAHEITGVHATMLTQHFDAPTELAKLRHVCQARRKLAYRRSRLSKYRAELVALVKAGASLRQLAIWLKRNKRITISHTSILRYLKKLPELYPESESEHP